MAASPPLLPSCLRRRLLIHIGTSLLMNTFRQLPRASVGFSAARRYLLQYGTYAAVFLVAGIMSVIGIWA